MPAWAPVACVHCGAPLRQPASGRPRRYCSPACKQAAYRHRAQRALPRPVTKLARKADGAFFCGRETYTRLARSTPPCIAS